MKKKIIIGLVALVALAVAIPVLANPLQFTSTASTAAATTSPVFMTPGTATTTLVYDTLQQNGTNQTNAGNNYVTDRSELLVQFTASSTSAKLNINIEYSQDGIDWYQETPTDLLGYATSTLPMLLIPVPQYSWTFASSTAGLGAVLSTTNRDTRSLSIKTPTRYVRAVFSCGLGGTNCAVWASMIPSKETK